MIKKRVFIQQPYFFPWLGYFSKLAAADCFVSLDCAAFRRNYLHRSQVLNSLNQRAWLTCPIGASQGVPLNTLYLPNDTQYVESFLEIIRRSYFEAPCFNTEFPFLSHLLLGYAANKQRTISENNLQAILTIADYLGIEIKETVLESKWSLPNNRNEKTIAIMDALSGGVLICGDGASTKVHDLSLFFRRGIAICVLPFFSEHPTYPQIHFRKQPAFFERGLSFIDALLNVGRLRTRELIYKVSPRTLVGG